MLFTVEANIGAGKSTFLRLCNSLRLKYPHVVIFEKVGDWTSMTDSSGKSIFDVFYEDKKRYSYVFQTYVLMSRASHLKETIQNNPGKIIICERSLLTDFEVFAKTLYESGDVSELEWNVYVKWHKIVRDLFDVPIVGQIYIRTSPENCLERIQTRSRQSENLIDKDYLQKLHKKHEEWLMDPEKNKTPTLIIDGNQNLLNNAETIQKELKMTEFFVNSLI
jgi:deoxyadenosine/deoxycytidine kinase